MPAGPRAASAWRSELPRRPPAAERRLPAAPMTESGARETLVDGRPPPYRCWWSLDQAGIKALRAQPTIAQTPHFALHHARQSALMPVLSTDGAPERTRSVNNRAPAAPPDGLGVIAPKRHARRAVTRNLVKRQVREAVRRWPLPAGSWLVRLRGPLHPRRCRSAASPALRMLVRAELDELLRRACAANLP